MNYLLVFLISSLTTAAKPLGADGMIAVLVEDLVFRQQLLIVWLSRYRVRNLSST